MALIHGVQVGFKEAYPGQPSPEISDLLQGIPQGVLLMVVSGILAEETKGNTRIIDILGFWFRLENQAFADDALARLQPIENSVGTIIVASVPAALKLYSYALNHLTEQRTLTDAEIEVALFKAFLVQNDLINAADDKVTETTENLPFEVRLPGMLFASSVRFLDLTEYDLHELFISEFIRAVYFFEFLEAQNNTKSLLIKFYETYDVSNWSEFMQRLSGISFSILNKTNSGLVELRVAPGENYIRDCKFLETLSSIPYDEVADNDFKSLREKPLQKIGEGEYRIIFGLFCIERIFKGMYFNLKAINQTISEELRVKDLRKMYTHQFSEEHALYIIGKKAFPKKWLCITGQEISDKKYEGGPDFYVRHKNKSFVFESKDSLINAALKETGDFTSLLEDLKTKFQYDGKSPKAARQLVNVIKDIFSGRFLTIDNGYNREHLTIYPIVVIHDRQLNVPGFNKLLNLWFDEELKKAPELSIAKIKPMTVIDMTTLVLTSELLNSRALSLEEVIDGYHEYVKLKKHYRNEAEYHQHARNTMLPFSFFLRQRIQKMRLKRYPERLLREKALGALNEFPEHS